MPKVIKEASIIKSAGNKPKIIKEYIGRINTNTESVSIAKMESPEGWIEPAQTPEFDEYTIVLKGTLRITADNETFDVNEGESIITYAGEKVQYGTPTPQGAEYIAICLPAFSLGTVHREE